MYLTLEEIRVDLKPVKTAKKGTHVSFKVPDKIRPSDKLYIMRNSEELLQERIKRQPFVILSEKQKQ
jgi:putative protease